MLPLQSIASKSGHNEKCGIHFKHFFQYLTLLHDIDSVILLYHTSAGSV